MHKIMAIAKTSHRGESRIIHPKTQLRMEIDFDDLLVNFDPSRPNVHFCCDAIGTKVAQSLNPSVPGVRRRSNRYLATDDAGISGAKGRDGRPGLDQMLKDAQRRRFDIVMAWAIDRLGRSLIDLLGTIETLQACGCDLYLDQQSIDTTTPAGRLMFQITGAFAGVRTQHDPPANPRRA
jgi:Resolvase, N terminal domain